MYIHIYLVSIGLSDSREKQEAIMQPRVSVFSSIVHPVSVSLHAFFKGNSIMMIMIFFLVFKKTAQQPLMRFKDSGKKRRKRTAFGVAH